MPKMYQGSKVVQLCTASTLCVLQGHQRLGKCPGKCTNPAICTCDARQVTLSGKKVSEKAKQQRVNLRAINGDCVTLQRKKKENCTNET